MQKKIPMRQCVGCREMRPKRELVRVVKSPEGEITLDFKGKAPGRGAYVCPNVDCLKNARKAKSVGSQLNLISNIREAKYVSRDEALDSFVEEMDSDAMFNGLDVSTFRDRYVVTLEDNSLMKETEAQIRAVDGVSDVNAPYEIINGFQTVQKVLNIASAVIIAVLFVVSLLIISNTVKLAMYSRSEEIAIMKMVGATNSFIRMPFVVEGFILGFLGALIAFFLQWGLYDFVAMKVAEIDSLQLITVAPFLDVIEPVALIYALTGFVVGVFGSLLSIRKFLKV